MTIPASQYFDIYDAALALDNNALKNALYIYNNIDFPNPFNGMSCPPIMQLAYEGEDEAVMFLIKHGAAKISAIFGYAWAGNVNKVAELSQGESVDLLKIGYHYACGGYVALAEQAYTDILQKNSNKQKAVESSISHAILFFSKQVNERQKIEILVTLKNVGIRREVAIALDARRISVKAEQLILKYKINFSQAVALLDPAFDYLMLSEKSRKSFMNAGVALPLEIFLEICKRVAPVQLSSDEVVELYTKVYLPRFKQPLLNDLKKLSLFGASANNIKNLQGQCERLSTRDQLLEQVSVEKERLKNESSVDPAYQEMLEKHIKRLK